ncbi:CRISPR-associated endonuclease Cas2 [Tepidicella xavieri]|uniref:CRISPR-associated endoribonuclease Cas2 n=1 Tax=Tepidicella xavieri TaxID=360241 RepID=A0A4R6UCJ9_9BURK|nr:CRISPR-associated endonuclease Cas2 [Tepidicella xavieri]TDQ44381.1 CRISPR-associated Cas2 family protein [Tepidicella xavieri]
MAQRGLYLVCYDVSSNRQRVKVQRYLAQYRVSGQKSVCECLMTPGEVIDCLAQLRAMIDLQTDRVHMLALDPRMPREGWGKGRPWDGGPLMVV